MFKNKLERFITKRVLIAFVILAVIDVAFIGAKWTTLLGLFIGGIFTLVRLHTNTFTFTMLLMPQKNGAVAVKRGVAASIVYYVLSQIITILILAITIKVNIWLFAGTAAGILLVPTVIVINGITEVLGVTHNNFE